MTLESKVTSVLQERIGDSWQELALCDGMYCRLMDDHELYDSLYKLYEKDMPYGTLTGEDEDPMDFISLQLLALVEGELKNGSIRD